MYWCTTLRYISKIFKYERCVIVKMTHNYVNLETARKHGFHLHIQMLRYISYFQCLTWNRNLVPILDKFREKHFGVCIYFSPNLANFHPVTTFATAQEGWAHDAVIKWKHFPRYCPLCGEFTGEFPSQKPVTRSFDMFFDLRLNKRLSNQRSGWWFETPLCSLWRHCNRISEKFNDFLWILALH